MRHYIFILITVFSFLTISCKKKAIRDRQKEIERVEGVWNVTSYVVEKFDTNGVLINKTTQNDIGEITFKLSSSYSKSSSLDFNSAQFKPSTLPVVYDFLYSKGAGDLSNGIYYCHWEVDPDKKRMMFWGTAPLNSYNINCDLELVDNGKKERILRFIGPTEVVTAIIKKQ